MGTGEVLEAGILRGQEVGFPKGQKAGEKQYITYKTSAKKARKLNKKSYGRRYDLPPCPPSPPLNTNLPKRNHLDLLDFPCAKYTILLMINSKWIVD